MQTRVHGRTVKRVIGGRELSRPEARGKAKGVLADLKVTVEASPQALITVAEFGDRFHADKSPGWAETARKLHMRDLKTNIGPWLGGKRIGDVTRVDVISRLDDLTIAPGSKNWALAVLSRMMRHAEMLDLRPPGSNPCKGLRRRKITFKAIYLTKAEYAHLGAAFRVLENGYSTEVAPLRFIALTGCRKGEALKLVDRQDRSSQFVSVKDGQPLRDSQLDQVWRQVRKRCQMPRLRIHDLRHSFASTAIGNGLGLRTIGGLLGHRDLSSTAAYAHLQEDALKASVARVGTHMSSLLAIKDRTPKSYRQMRVVDGVVTDGPAKRGPKLKPKLEVVESAVDPSQVMGKPKSRRKPKRRTAAQIRAAEKLRALAAVERKRKLVAEQKQQQAEAKRIAAVIRQFQASRLSVPEFCKSEGLNENVFRDQLIAWRDARRVAA